MKPLRAICLCFLSLVSVSLPAQDTPSAPVGTILIHSLYYHRPGSTTLLYLKDGDFKSNEESVKRDDLLLKYTYNGRDYRKLSKRELTQFDAMPKVEVRQNALYFDGKKMETNVKRVFRVHAAYYWNGGVLLAANTSHERFLLGPTHDLGFLDMQAGTCRFTCLFAKAFMEPVVPDFLAPVTMDTSNGDLALDVAMPENVYDNERFDMIISVTNNSDRPIRVPDSLAEGLGIVLTDDLADPDEYEKKDYVDGVLPHIIKRPAHLYHSDIAPPPLEPHEWKSCALPVSAGAILSPFGLRHRFGRYPRFGRTRLVFYWDTFLDPGDRERMTRLTCEKWVEVVKPPQVDASGGDLALEVGAPTRASLDGRAQDEDPYFLGYTSQSARNYDDFGNQFGHEIVHAGGTYIVMVTLTNVSQRTILVPDDLGDGLGVMRVRPKLRLQDGTVQDYRSTVEEKKLVASSAKVFYDLIPLKNPAIRSPYAAHCSPLAPGATREAMVPLDPLRLFLSPNRLPLTFVWDGLLDPDDREHVSRFSTGKTVWVEVTK